MRKAFVLVNSELGSEDELQSELKKVEGIVGVYQVYGVYDLIVEVEAESGQKLKESIVLQNSCAQACEVYAYAYHGVLTRRRFPLARRAALRYLPVE